MSEQVVLKIENRIAAITLNRPENGNSYDHSMCKEITAKFAGIKNNSDVNLVVLNSVGKNFCTGADLGWMLKAQDLSPAENIKDMSVIQKMYDSINALEVPLIVCAKGKIRGGGLGMVACGDIVIADSEANFALSEVRLGLIPGIITPLIVNKIGESHFKELALTGREFQAAEAKELGLVHQICTGDEGQFLKTVLSNLEAGSPEAMRAIKKSLREENYLEISAGRRLCRDFLERSKIFKK